MSQKEGKGMKTIQSWIMFSAHALSPCGLPPTFSLLIGQPTFYPVTDNKARRYISTAVYSNSSRVEENEAEVKVETGGHPINTSLSRAPSAVHDQLPVFSCTVTGLSLWGCPFQREDALHPVKEAEGNNEGSRREGSSGG